MSIVKQLLALVLIALTAADEGTEHVVQHQHQHRHRRSVASCLLEARVTGFEVSNSTERSDKSSSCRRAKVWPVSCLFTPIDFIDTTAAIESCFHCCFAYHARRLAALGDALDGPVHRSPPPPHRNGVFAPGASRLSMRCLFHGMLHLSSDARALQHS